MTSQTYPSGKVIGYEYDDKGELVSIKIDGVPFIKNIKTNDNGLLSYSYADGSKHKREYDKNGRVTKLIYPNYSEKVNYNRVSNITNIKSDAISRAFGYDNLDRLTSYKHNSDDFQNFVYDANGNRLNQSQENNQTKLFTYAENSNTLNSIKETNSTDTKEIAYEYDKTGNIIKDDKHTYSYDSRNRLVAIDDNVTYQYNYDNKRVSKTIDGNTTYFIYDGHMLVGEYDEDGNIIKEYVYNGSTPIATTTTKETYRVYADHLDTSRRVEDSKGKIVWKWESKPFGEDEAIGSLEFNLRFPGQYFDGETSTHYNINRDYNPVTGRYIQSDPIGFDGGLNGYVYVGGNSLIYIDKEGLHKFDKLYGFGKDFWNWFHKLNNGKDMKSLKGSNGQVSKEDAEGYYDYWKEIGKPKPDSRRNWKDLFSFLIPLPVYFACEWSPCNYICEDWGYECNLDSYCL